jgi:hypothetical protein
MFLSEEESKRRRVELERRQGITPEVKRFNEIKAGVITGSVGLALTIFLYVLMQGIIMGGKIPQDAVEILSRIWVVGVIPFFVGISLIINGVFVSKRLAEIARRAAQDRSNMLERDTDPRSLRSADTTEFIPSGFSVTEGTTKHLRDQKSEVRDQRSEIRDQRSEIRDQTSNGRNSLL